MVLQSLPSILSVSCAHNCFLGWVPFLIAADVVSLWCWALIWGIVPLHFLCSNVVEPHSSMLLLGSAGVAAAADLIEMFHPTNKVIKSPANHFECAWKEKHMISKHLKEPNKQLGKLGPVYISDLSSDNPNLWCCMESQARGDLNRMIEYFRLEKASKIIKPAINPALLRWWLHHFLGSLLQWTETPWCNLQPFPFFLSFFTTWERRRTPGQL